MTMVITGGSSFQLFGFTPMNPERNILKSRSKVDERRRSGRVNNAVEHLTRRQYASGSGGEGGEVSDFRIRTTKVRDSSSSSSWTLHMQ